MYGVEAVTLFFYSHFQTRKNKHPQTTPVRIAEAREPPPLPSLSAQPRDDRSGVCFGLDRIQARAEQQGVRRRALGQPAKRVRSR